MKKIVVWAAKIVAQVLTVIATLVFTAAQILDEDE